MLLSFFLILSVCYVFSSFSKIRYVVEQLQCLGILQTCEVLKVGMPTRVTYIDLKEVTTEERWRGRKSGGSCSLSFMVVVLKPYRPSRGERRRAGQRERWVKTTLAVRALSRGDNRSALRSPTLTAVPSFCSIPCTRLRSPAPRVDGGDLAVRLSEVYQGPELPTSYGQASSHPVSRFPISPF